MTGLFQTFCLGIGVFMISVLFFGGTMLIRSFPALYDLFTRMMRTLLIWSYRGYHYLLVYLDPYLQSIRPYSLLVNPARTMATVCISLLAGCLLCLLLHWQMTLFIAVICGAHGIFIGLAWQNFFEPTGLHLGERLQ